MLPKPVGPHLGQAEAINLYGSAPYQSFETEYERPSPFVRVTIKWMRGAQGTLIAVVPRGSGLPFTCALVCLLDADDLLTDAWLYRCPPSWFQQLEPYGSRASAVLAEAEAGFPGGQAFPLVGEVDAERHGNEIFALELRLRSRDRLPPFDAFFAHRSAELDRWEPLLLAEDRAERSALTQPGTRGVPFRIEARYRQRWAIFK